MLWHFLNRSIRGKRSSTEGLSGFFSLSKTTLWGRNCRRDRARRQPATIDRSRLAKEANPKKRNPQNFIIGDFHRLSVTRKSHRTLMFDVEDTHVNQRSAASRVAVDFRRFCWKITKHQLPFLFHSRHEVSSTRSGCADRVGLVCRCLCSFPGSDVCRHRCTCS